MFSTEMIFLFCSRPVYVSFALQRRKSFYYLVCRKSKNSEKYYWRKRGKKREHYPFVFHLVLSSYSVQFHRNEVKFHLTNKFVFNPITNYRFVSVAFNCVFAYDDLVEKIFTDQLDSLAAYFVSFSSASFSLFLRLLHGFVRFACTDCFNVKFIASCRSLRPLCAPVRSFW